MSEKQSFLITVFAPTEKDSNKPKLKDLAMRLQTALLTACGQAPTFVHPDTSKLVLLAHGDFNAIVKALSSVCHQNDEPWLLAQVGTPCTASGLSRAAAWIQTRSSVS